MNHPNRKETITVLVDGRTKAKLRRLAGDSYRTLSGYVRHLILAHIREAEALRGPIPDEEPLCPGPGGGIMPSDRPTISKEAAQPWITVSA